MIDFQHTFKGTKIKCNYVTCKSDSFFISGGKYSKPLNKNQNIIIIFHPCFLRNVFQIKRQHSVLICMQFIFQVSISMRHTNEFVTLCAGKYHVQSGDAGRQRWDTSAQRTCCSALLTVLPAKTHASSFPLAFSAVPFFADKTNPISEF